MKRNTLPVSDPVFRQVYDSPASLPGRHKWLTPIDEVRKIEELLGMPTKTIGAPLWVSGDRKRCPKCRRETTVGQSWYRRLDEVQRVKQPPAEGRLRS